MSSGCVLWGLPSSRLLSRAAHMQEPPQGVTWDCSGGGQCENSHVCSSVCPNAQPKRSSPGCRPVWPEWAPGAFPEVREHRGETATACCPSPPSSPLSLGKAGAAGSDHLVAVSVVSLCALESRGKQWFVNLLAVGP